jgi:DNA-binding transcriptional ArsR family regulator
MIDTVSRKRAVAFFRSLADENRLRILGALAGRAWGVEELATTLDLKPSSVAHQLDHLKGLGVVSVHEDGTTHFYRLDLAMLRRMCRETLVPEPVATFDDGAPVEAWERDVLKHFFEGERLQSIPASQKKRLVVLKWLVGRFELGTRYPEAEVNAILQRYHPDCAALRRYLVDNQFMQRDHGIYWRIDEGVGGQVSGVGEEGGGSLA